MLFSMNRIQHCQLTSACQVLPELQRIGLEPCDQMAITYFRLTLDTNISSWNKHVLCSITNNNISANIRITDIANRIHIVEME